MIIKTRQAIPNEQKMGMHGVTKELVVGGYDGSDQIVLRIISIAPGRFIPPHTHDFPHIWKVERGTGILTDGAGAEHEVTAGRFIFIPNNELHGMKNIGKGELEYLCFGTADTEQAGPKKEPCGN